jgi:hypothetical protein
MKVLLGRVLLEQTTEDAVVEMVAGHLKTLAYTLVLRVGFNLIAIEPGFKLISSFIDLIARRS